jgi:hypothetical protein
MSLLPTEVIYLTASHTSLAVQLISSLFITLTLGCVSTTSNYDGYSPLSHVYNEDFDLVWRAAQIALQKYPIRVNNIDKGELETEWIANNEIWSAPQDLKTSRTGTQYRLTIRTIKGRIQNESAIKVTIQKFIEKKRDFFAEVEKPPSDGLEEKVLLYRIEREIQIERALQLAQEKSN